MLRRCASLVAKTRIPTFASSAAAAPMRAFSAVGDKRPFKILGVQQIALGALDKGALSHFWVDIMGLTKVKSFVSAKENVDEDVLSIGTGPLAVEVDLMQPLDADKAPKVHVPALNHVGFWVDDLPACVSSLTAQGVRFTPGGIRKGASGHDVCFIHPVGTKDDTAPIGACGVLVELVQAPADVIAALSPKQ